MRVRDFVAVLTLMIMLSSGVLAAAEGCDPQSQVTFCHRQGGTMQTITTSECGYLSGHKLQHNDTLGPCPAGINAAPQNAPSITCEQAIEQGLLRASIDGDKVLIRNDAPAAFTVSVASYQMYAALTEDQTLFDASTLTVLARNTSEATIDLPACAYQLDVVCGEPKTPPLYGARVINATFGDQGDYCVHDQNGNVTLSIAPHYPKNNTFVFICEAQGFTPTEYNWYFGDGQILPHTERGDVFRKYAPGNYTVACTATDGVQQGTGVLNISVSGKIPPNMNVNATNSTNSTGNQTPNSTGNTTVPPPNNQTNATKTNQTQVNSTNQTNGTPINQTPGNQTGNQTNVTLPPTNATNNTGVPNTTTNQTTGTPSNQTNGTVSIPPNTSTNVSGNVSTNSTGTTNGTNETGNGTATNSTSPNTTDPGDGPDDAEEPTLTQFSSNGGAKHCWRGWHKEGDICVKDEVVIEEPQEEQTEETPVQAIDPFTQQPFEPVPKAQEVVDIPHPADRGDLLTGNVTGEGTGASTWWLLALIGTVIAGLGIYAYKRK